MNILKEKSWGKCSKHFFIIVILLLLLIIIVIMIVRIPQRGSLLEHQGSCDIRSNRLLVALNRARFPISTSRFLSFLVQWARTQLTLFLILWNFVRDNFIKVIIIIVIIVNLIIIIIVDIIIIVILITNKTSSLWSSRLPAPNPINWRWSSNVRLP